VIATQNPSEHFGTFALPDSQLDRFLMRIRIGYPEAEIEREILEAHRLARPVETLPAVLTREELLALQREVREVHVDPSLSDYLIRIVGRTRVAEGVEVGASPRGSLDLYRAAQARALLSGRDFCVPTTSRHWPYRCSPTASSFADGRRGLGNPRGETLRRLVSEVPVPV